MVNQLRKFARETNSPSLRLYAYYQNETALKVYYNLGMKKVESTIIVEKDFAFAKDKTIKTLTEYENIDNSYTYEIL